MWIVGKNSKGRMVWLNCVQASQFQDMSQSYELSSMDHIVHMLPPILENLALLDVL